MSGNRNDINIFLRKELSGSIWFPLSFNQAHVLCLKVTICSAKLCHSLLYQLPLTATLRIPFIQNHTSVGSVITWDNDQGKVLLRLFNMYCIPSYELSLRNKYMYPLIICETLLTSWRTLTYFKKWSSIVLSLRIDVFELTIVHRPVYSFIFI